MAKHPKKATVVLASVELPGRRCLQSPYAEKPLVNPSPPKSRQGKAADKASSASKPVLLF